ncbi:MAG: S8 family serine peptidase [Planctomycetes bacterium]|nr:S8 family serine peptidase [Planctomycetota bacterium]
MLAIDFGDAPDSYKTLDASGGPKHEIGALFLGTYIDGEPDGYPDQFAEDDDDDQLPNDEDGLVRTSQFIIGQLSSIDVFASAAGKLDAWMDLNGNGQFDHPDEHINDGVSASLNPGVNTLTFTIPGGEEGAVAGTSFARLRISSAGGLAPGGSAADGEVEDYEVQILGGGFGTERDYGDAPNSYQTLAQSSGPSHLITSLFLGNYVDGESNGTPDQFAESDDDDRIPNDEDGLVGSSLFVPGQSASINVRASGSGQVDAWIDYNLNGQFDHPSEHIGGGTSASVTAGVNTINFSIPATATAGNSFARIRLSSAGSLFPLGQASDGEVEDYEVIVFGQTSNQFDFGDAPDSYQTLNTSGGAKHQLGGGLYLGALVDGEPDGSPATDAEGDAFEQFPNDEDGVVRTSLFVAGQSASIDVIASASGKLDAWLDLNGNGQFDHPDEHIDDGTSVPVNAGLNTINFDIPVNAIAGETYARVRISTTGNLGPAGQAADGEVEDYRLVVLSGNGGGGGGGAVQIIDDGDAGFTQTGFAPFAVGYQGDEHFVAAGNGSATASWTFEVTPGRYRVSSTWDPHANRASNVPYTIMDGTTQVAQVAVSQETAPNDLTDAGGNWEDVATVDITSTTLKVMISNDANEFVFADAVRIERVGSLVMEPEIQVLDGATDIADGGTINFGTTTPNTPVDKVLTVKNVGTENLTMTPLNGGNFPNGFSLVQNFGSPTLSPNQSTTFTVRLSSASESNFGGAINFANNDGDENPFDLNLQGVVANVPPPPPTPVVQIIDDGDAGFTQTGFAPFAVGYQGDEHFVAAGNGSATASWTFDVTPGRYRVSSTWDPHANRADNVPYTILDGTTQVASVAVNQEVAPNDFTDAGGDWEDVATVDIFDTTLKVMLTNDANEYVFADAVRIERNGDITQIPGSPSAPANSNIPDVTLPAPDANEFIDSGGIQISTRTIGVIFESNATVGDVNDLISSIDATIVGGQSSTKLLFLALPPSNTLENVVSAIVSLNNDARVVVATPNTLQTTRQLSNNSDQFARGWVWETTPNGGNNGLELIRAPQAWNLQTYGARNGDVADVGVIDSSFDPTHPDLAGRLQVPPSTPAQLTVTCPMGISAPCISEHGTHVTGIIAAQGDNPLGVEGVAPHNPNIIGRVANVATLQTIQTIYSILAENRDVVAINMSFGLKEYAANINPQTDNVRDPIPFTYSQMMFLAGIAHNTAAANFIAANARSNFLLPSAVGYDARPGVVRVQDDSGMNSAAILNPSGHYIAVEAVNQSNSNPTGTNLGGTISAPGIGIRSTESTSAGDYDRSATGTSDGDPNYATISGTSQATPHVTGLISYLWHLAPDLTFDQVRDLVTHSDFTVQTNNGTQPRIDAFAAVMGIDQKKSNFTLQKALVDVDDGSLDGNARNDVDDEDGDGNTLESFVSGNVAGVDATGIKHGDGLRGDGVVDMKDFRAFRDAMLQVLLSENSLSSSDLDLDGAAGSLKRDLNLDGRVNLVPTTSDPPYENVFPRYDFNGSGAMEADGILVTPGSTGVAPFKIDPDTSCSNLNSPAGCLRDIDVLANPAIWQVDQEGVSTTDLLADRDNDETIDYLYSADFHFNIGPDPQANSADLSIQVESLQGGPNGAVTWSKTINIPGPLSAQNATKRIITVPLFGDRVDNAVKVTVARGGGSGSFTFGAVQYGKDRVVRVEN